MKAPTLLALAVILTVTGCTAAPAPAPVPTPSQTAGAEAAPELDSPPVSRLTAECFALVDPALIEAVVAGAVPQPRNETDAVMAQAGAEECHWSGAGSFSIGILPDGAEAFDSAGLPNLSDFAGSPGERSTAYCGDAVCGVDFVRNGYWVELDVWADFSVQNSSLVSMPGFVTAFAALAAAVDHEVSGFGPPAAAWKSPVTSTITPSDTGCAQQLDPAPIFAAVGWSTGGMEGFGVHSDVASAADIRTAAELLQHSSACQWSSKEYPDDPSAVGMSFVPGSAWSWPATVTRLKAQGYTSVMVDGVEEAYRDPTGVSVFALVDHTVLQLWFSGFSALDPVASGAAASASAAAAAVID